MTAQAATADQPPATVQHVGRLFLAQVQPPAVPHAIELSQVTIHRLDAVVGLARHLLACLALAIPLPADQPLVRQPRPYIVQRRPPRYQTVAAPIVVGQHPGHLRVVAAQQHRQIAIAQQASLLVGLPAQPQTTPQQALVRLLPIQDRVDVLARHQLQQQRHQLQL